MNRKKKIIDLDDIDYNIFLSYPSESLYNNL